jgi:transcriptional regulator with XRE-family HTH domain
MLVGRIIKSGAWWIAECEAAHVWTQGRTRHQAVASIAAALELKVNKPGFRVTARENGADPAGGYAVWIESNDAGALAALVLLEEREWNRLSLADVAKALGAASRNAYAAYEQGRREPTLSKLCELLKAVGSDVVLVLAPKANARGLSRGYETARSLRIRPKSKKKPALRARSKKDAAKAA